MRASSLLNASADWLNVTFTWPASRNDLLMISRWVIRQRSRAPSNLCESATTHSSGWDVRGSGVAPIVRLMSVAVLAVAVLPAIAATNSSRSGKTQKEIVTTNMKTIASHRRVLAAGISPVRSGPPADILVREVWVSDTEVLPTLNTTGFADFVFIAMGDSYAAGEGNPRTPAGNTVTKSPDFGLTAASGGLPPLLRAALEASTGPFGAALGASLIRTGSGIPAFALIGDRPVIKGEPRFVNDWGGTNVLSSEYRDAHRCHRSSNSGAAKAARALQSEFQGRVNVRFISVACSGAQAVNLTSVPYKVAESNLPGDPDKYIELPTQIQQIGMIEPAVNHIDALYLSAGGNDAGFATAVAECAVSPLSKKDADTGLLVDLECQNTDLPDRIQNGWENKEAEVSFKGLKSLEKAYKDIDEALQNLGNILGKRDPLDKPDPLMTPQHVYISHYPNAMRGSDGITRCTGFLPGTPLHDDTLGFLTEGEASYAETVLLDINRAVTAAVRAYEPSVEGRSRGGWKLVKFFGENDGAAAEPQLDDDYATHGVCARRPWINDGAKSLRIQGPDAYRLKDVMDVSTSILHPNDGGYDAYKNRILPQLRAQVKEMIDLVPERPARVRQVAGVLGGPITIRWDDRAKNEDKYVIYRRRLPDVLPPSVLADVARVRAGNAVSALAFEEPFVRVARLDSNVQQYRDRVRQPGTFEYLIVACSRYGKCSVPIGNIPPVRLAMTQALGPTVIATNEPPTVPTFVMAEGGSARTELSRPGTIAGREGNSRLSWRDNPRNQSFRVDLREDLDGAATSRALLDLRFPDVTLGPVGLLGDDFQPVVLFSRPILPAEFTVRGCNLFGCSGASQPSVAVVAGSSRQEMEIPDIDEQRPGLPGRDRQPSLGEDRPGTTPDPRR